MSISNVVDEVNLKLHDNKVTEVEKPNILIAGCGTGQHSIGTAVKFKNSGRKTSSRSYAERALSFQPSMGKAYILIANLYASSANACGDSQFNKRAVYWLAAQTAQKAGRVDASIRKTANNFVASYNGRAPSKTDIFTEGNQGQTVRFSCWIARSVKVPNL